MQNWPIAALKTRLEDLGYAFPEDSSLDRLRALLVRADRSLPSYDDCSVAELREFTEQRKLKIPALKSQKKPDLIKALERADEDRTFFGTRKLRDEEEDNTHKAGELVHFNFEDLAPELRVLVYEFYFQHIRATKDWYHDPLALCDYSRPGGISAAPPPPITEVSKLLRTESLPVWYQMSPLFIPIVCGTRGRRKNAWSSEHIACGPATTYQQPYHGWRDFHIGLHIDTYKDLLTRGLIVEHLRWIVKVSMGGDTFAIRALHSTGQDMASREMQIHEKIEKSLKMLFERVCRQKEFALTHGMVDSRIPAIFGTAFQSAFGRNY